MPPVFGPCVAVARPLEVLRGQQRHDGGAVGDARTATPRGRRGTPRSAPAARASTPGRAPAPPQVRGDHDALAGGQAVVLDHVRGGRTARPPRRARSPARPGHRPARARGRARRPRPSRAWRRTCCPRAGRPALTGRSRRCRPSRSASAAPATSGTSGPIDHEVGAPPAGERGDRLGVGHVQRDGVGERAGAGVARGARKGGRPPGRSAERRTGRAPGRRSRSRGRAWLPNLPSSRAAPSRDCTHSLGYAEVALPLRHPGAAERMLTGCRRRDRSRERKCAVTTR